ncbi:MAG: V-type ATP synthase subunit A [Nitrospirae bacterium]|nr:MAG: V-type ATP synthase subunit A [Nitrospirota bacterium]
MDKKGIVIGVNKNLITVEVEGEVMQNEVAYVLCGESRLKSEVIRVRGNMADLQVFEDTRGIKKGDLTLFTDELLSAELGPGLLGQLYDGLQNPLDRLAEAYGVFLKRGVYIPAISESKKWKFTPSVKIGDNVKAGSTIGFVPEGIFEHKIMVPFNLTGRYEVVDIVGEGEYRVTQKIATVIDKKKREIPLTMKFDWPVKRPIKAYKERLNPSEPLITRIRLIDTLFPVAKGGTYCIPGPFGAGKTVLQQITSRNAEVNIVIIAACGERAGEVVETIREFPKIIDPLTGRSLMERTIIVCNTSSMPVAAREASIYTAVTMAEYYRQMGLHVLMLADSTSRWAQALRERSGRLEEIPGEEAFPAYLESLIAAFYERAGFVLLDDGSKGSVTIGGTVSPAGGNFDEPVTQATLKVVGAFHGLSRERSDARKYPAIDPLESWSKYRGIVDDEKRRGVLKLLSKANDIDQMMKVVGEEGTPIEDYIIYLKGEFFDRVYLQQNAFDPVDGSTPKERQVRVFSLIKNILETQLSFKSKNEARSFFNKLRLLFLDYNSIAWDSEAFYKKEEEIKAFVEKYAKEMPLYETIPVGEVRPDYEVDSTFARYKKSVTIKKPELMKEENEENIQ